MAINKLYAMAEALSVIPTVFTWPIKKFTTSYKGIPLKPGNDVALLLSIIILTGLVAATLFPILVRRGIIY